MLLQLLGITVIIHSSFVREFQGILRCSISESQCLLIHYFPQSILAPVNIISFTVYLLTFIKVVLRTYYCTAYGYSLSYLLLSCLIRCLTQLSPLFLYPFVLSLTHWQPPPLLKPLLNASRVTGYTCIRCVCVYQMCVCVHEACVRVHQVCVCARIRCVCAHQMCVRASGVCVCQVCVRVHQVCVCVYVCIKCVCIRCV